MQKPTKSDGKDSCVKSPCLAKKFLTVVHIAIYQTRPSITGKIKKFITSRIMGAVRKKNRCISVQQIPEHICSLFVLLVITVHMLSFPQAGYVMISEWKYSFFLGISGAFVISMILMNLELWLIKIPTFVKKQKAYHSRAVPIFLLLYLIFTILSGLLSAYPQVLLGGERREGILTIGLYVLTALFLMRRLRPGRWLLPAFALSMILFCSLGIVQLTGANPFGLYPDGYNFYDAGIYYSGQYWSTIGNTNLCSALLAVSAAVFSVAVIRKKSTANWLYMLPLCLSVFSILELNAEAGIVAVMGGLLCMLPIVVRSWQMLCNALAVFGGLALTTAISFAVNFRDGGADLNLGRGTVALFLVAVLLGVGGLALQNSQKVCAISSKTLRMSLGLIVAAVIISGLLVLYFYESFPDGFLAQAHQLMHGDWNDAFGSNRLYIWRQVWELVWDAPLFGGGPDTVGQRGLVGFSRYSDELHMTVTSTIDVAHNEYLNILVNQGILSLLPYLTAIGVSFLNWWKNADSDAAAISGAALLFYCIQAFFGISMCSTAPYFWIALAILNIKTDEKERRL